MASREVDNVIDFQLARDIRRRSPHQIIEINGLSLGMMVGFCMWAGIIITTVWVWRHVLD